ncbi:hypothetical protein SFUMM280S_10769 [Streptomyces fumanus]
MKRRRTALLSLTALLATALTALPAAPAGAEETEQVKNGTFDNGTESWWSSSNVTAGVEDGRLCADVPGGTTNRWDAAVGQNDIPLVAGETYRFSFQANGTPADHVVRAVVGLSVSPYDTYYEVSPQLSVSGNSYSYTFTAPVDTAQGQVAFQVGGSAEPWRFCVDDVSLLGGVPPEQYEPDTGPRVRVNQVAYLPSGPKNATLVTDATTALPWQLKNAGGTVVARGTSVPRGVDASSGQNVHSIDFGRYKQRGEGYTLVADGETSRPFDIGTAAYDKLRADAAKYYYTQRSGIAIREDLRPGYARPAGHLGVAPNQGDTDVPCQPGVCDYRLNAAGGWYDAGGPRSATSPRWSPPSPGTASTRPAPAWPPTPPGGPPPCCTPSPCSSRCRRPTPGSPARPPSPTCPSRGAAVDPPRGALAGLARDLMSGAADVYRAADRLRSWQI